MNADFYFSSADDTDNTDLFFIFRIGFKHGAAFKVRVHPLYLRRPRTNSRPYIIISLL
jgi:uncharacterized membrane protein